MASFGGGYNRRAYGSTPASLNDSLSRVAQEWEGRKNRESSQLRTRINELESSNDELECDLTAAREELAGAEKKNKALQTERELADQKTVEATALLKAERCRMLGAQLLIADLATDDEEQEEEEEDEGSVVVVVSGEEEEEEEKKKLKKKKRRLTARAKCAAVRAAAANISISARRLVEGARQGELGVVVRSVGIYRKGDKNNTVLHEAAELILSAALDSASRNGHLRVCQVLIDAGASSERACGLEFSSSVVEEDDESSARSWPESALVDSMKITTPPVLLPVEGEVLLDPLMNVSEMMRVAPTLHATIAAGHDEVAKLLLRGGATANYAAAALNGATPLHTAAAHNRSELARHLISKCNARIDAVDDTGRSAATIATERRWTRVTAVLSDPTLLFWSRANKANRLCKEGEHELALASFEKALHELNRMNPKPSKPNMATLHHNRAKSLVALGRSLKAREALDAALALHEDNFHASSLERRADCHSALFEHGRAAEDLRTLQTLSTDATPAKIAEWKRKEDLERKKATMSPREILGFTPNDRKLDATTLRAAYRRLSIKWHPDRQSTKTAECQHRAHLHFQRINAAHETLSAALDASSYRPPPRAWRSPSTASPTSAWMPDKAPTTISSDDEDDDDEDDDDPTDTDDDDDDDDDDDSTSAQYR